MVIETKRLFFRKISYDDYGEIAKILKDSEVMYAWEKAFSDEEVKEWIDKNLKRYEEEGYSYLLAIDKNENNVVGVMGPLIENINGEEFMGIAYILNKKSWGKGYAIEGAKGCVDYAFKKLGAQKVIAEVRPSNKKSIKVVEKLGMIKTDSFIKIYDNKKMEHIIYAITKEQFYNTIF